MKADIHPTYFGEAKAVCACGASYIVGSTREKIGVEICSSCHPFYTGLDKVIDTAGRVERFKARREASAKVSAKAKKAPKSEKTEEKN